MDASSWAALVFGAIGTVTGISALIVSFKSYKTNARMANSNEALVRSSEVAAQAAREAVDSQVAAERAKQAAVLKPVTTDKGAIGWSRDGTSGQFVMRLRNEGQATAYDVRITGTLSFRGRNLDSVTLGPSGVVTISPGEVLSYSLDLTEAQFGDVADRDVDFNVSYRDGLGAHAVSFKVLVYNYWSQDWSNQLLASEPLS